MPDTGLAPLCFACGRLRGAVPGTGWACDAFPTGVPVAILVKQHDHRRPYEGDRGLRFVPKEDDVRQRFAKLVGHIK